MNTAISLLNLLIMACRLGRWCVERGWRDEARGEGHVDHHGVSISLSTFFKMLI